MSTEHFDTVIVGGGQAGLATGYHLQRKGREFVILDAGERVGDSWRERWPSLRLYSPAKFDGLPGMPFPAPRNSWPSTNEFADFLEAYAEPLRAARADRRARRSPLEGRRSVRGDGRRATLRGGQRRRRDGGHAGAGHARARGRPRPADQAAPLVRVPEPAAAAAGSRARRRSSPLGQRHRVRAVAAPRDDPGRPRHRSDPGPAREPAHAARLARAEVPVDPRSRPSTRRSGGRCGPRSAGTAGRSSATRRPTSWPPGSSACTRG